MLLKSARLTKDYGKNFKRKTQIDNIPLVSIALAENCQRVQLNVFYQNPKVSILSIRYKSIVTLCQHYSRLQTARA